MSVVEIRAEEIREGDEVRGGRGQWLIAESDADPDDGPIGSPDVVVWFAGAPVTFRADAVVTVAR